MTVIVLLAVILVETLLAHAKFVELAEILLVDAKHMAVHVFSMHTVNIQIVELLRLLAVAEVISHLMIQDPYILVLEQLWVRYVQRHMLPLQKNGIIQHVSKQLQQHLVELLDVDANLIIVFSITHVKVVIVLVPNMLHAPLVPTVDHILMDALHAITIPSMHKLNFILLYLALLAFNLP